MTKDIGLKMIDTCSYCLLIFLMPAVIVAAELLKPGIDLSYASILPVTILLLPIVGVFLFFLVKNKEETIKDILAILITVLSMLHIIFMIKYVFNPVELEDKMYKGLIYTFTYMPNFDLSLRVDKISMIILMIAAAFWLIVGIFVLLQNQKGSNKYKNYSLYILIALFLNFGVVMAGDFLTIFLYFEAISIFPYFIIIYKKPDVVAHEEKRFLLVEVITGICLLLGIILFYYFAGTLVMKDMVLHFATQVPPLWSGIIFVMMFLGFVGKTSLFFQHLLPNKTNSNVLMPIPGSFIFSSILFQLAAYGVFRYVTVSLYHFKI